MGKELINKEQLIEMSAIFSEHKDEHLNISEEVVAEKNDTKLCKVITLTVIKDVVGVHTYKLFPDSKVTVIYNSHLSSYFVGVLTSERVFDRAFSNIEVEAVTVEFVIFKCTLADNSTCTLIAGEKGMCYIHNNQYTLDIEECKVHINDIAGNPYSKMTSSTETPEVREIQNSDLMTLTYDDIIYSVDYNHKTVFYIEKNTNVKVLLTFKGYSMLGYYLTLNSTNESIITGGEQYTFISRPTTAIALVYGEKTDKVYIISCTNQLLVELSSVTDYTLEEIEYVNGLALLLKSNESGYTLNVFTPNHQGVVLSNSFDLDNKSIGNGIYFKKDNVILLENGSLLFSSTTQKGRVVVKGKEFKLPISYLGID